LAGLDCVKLIAPAIKITPAAIFNEMDLQRFNLSEKSEQSSIELAQPMLLFVNRRDPVQ